MMAVQWAGKRVHIFFQHVDCRMIIGLRLQAGPTSRPPTTHQQQQLTLALWQFKAQRGCPEQSSCRAGLQQFVNAFHGRPDWWCENTQPRCWRGGTAVSFVCKSELELQVQQWPALSGCDAQGDDEDDDDDNEVQEWV